MEAVLSGRGEVDTSRAFQSVKEAVAVFGERILAREGQFRPNASAHGDRPLRLREGNGVAIAALDAKLEGSGGVRSSGLLVRESYSKPSVTFNIRQEGSSSRSNINSRPMAVSDDSPMYLVPSSPPFFASSPSLANDDDDDEEERERKEADLAVASSVKKLEEEAARARQEVAQLKRRLAEMELSVATLNAKLHRALSKLAHMEADNAAAARASIEMSRARGGGGDDMALALWAERRAAAPSSTRQLGHLMGLGVGVGGEAETEAVAGGQLQAVAPAAARRKVQKQKPIVPLLVPLINGVLFSKKRRTKDKESVYMKELYSLLRLS